MREGRYAPKEPNAASNSPVDARLNKKMYDRNRPISCDREIADPVGRSVGVESRQASGEALIFSSYAAIFLLPYWDNLVA